MENKQVPLLRRISKEQLMVTGGALAATGIVDIATHATPTGLFFSLCALGLAAKHSQDIVNLFVPGSDAGQVIDDTDQVLDAILPDEQPHPDQRPLSKLKRLVGMKTEQPETEQPKQPRNEQAPAQPAQEPPYAQSPAPAAQYHTTTPDAGVSPFARTQETAQAQGPARITVDAMVAHTAMNSYETYIGTSLTAKPPYAVKINFYKRHIKIIGASQHGKSSMAGALLASILRTHDKDHVLVALLDPENKTSRIFADAPQLAEVVTADGEVTTLHARNPQEVLARLEMICRIIDWRYTLSEAELDALPLLIVYLEELIELKDFFKNKIDEASNEQEKEHAKYQYSRLVFCMKRISRAGLKVLVQFILCAQVNYRDEDLQEALVNVTSGMSFCVLPTAAKAAGFYQTELIARNARDDQKGQYVVEMPEVKDLILAPDFDLKKRLRALPPVYKNPVSVNAESPVYRPVNSRVNASTSQMEPLVENPRLRLPVNAETPDFEHKEAEQEVFTGNVNAETREIIARMVAMDLPHRQIAKAVKLDGRNYPIYKQVCRELNITIDRNEA